MPRPTTKATLLELSQANYDKLLALINGYGPEEQEAEFPEGTMNRNIRDVLAHLHQWHNMMLDWYTVGMTGAKPHMPAKGYTWKDTSKLNRKIWEDYQATSLAAAKNLLDQSHVAVRQLIERHSEEELFEKKRYHWTGSTSLAAYLISATSSHYDWAYKLIRKVKKAA